MFCRLMPNLISVIKRREIYKQLGRQMAGKYIVRQSTQFMLLIQNKAEKFLSTCNLRVDGMESF
jgi:hypothetical protein